MLLAFQWHKKDKVHVCKTKSDPGLTWYAVRILLSAYDSEISKALGTLVQSEACFCDAGRAPDCFAGKPPSQTGFPKEVSGRGSFVLTLALPSGQPCRSSPTVNRQLEATGEHSFLLFLRPLTSLSSLVIAGIYGDTGCTSKSLLQSLFTSCILLRRAASFGLPHWPKGVAPSFYTVRKSWRLVSSSHYPTVIVHKRLVPNLYLPLQPGIAFPRIHCYFYGLYKEVLYFYYLFYFS